MAATIGLFAASMAWIIGTSGGPDMLPANSLMSAPVMQTSQMILSEVSNTKTLQFFYFALLYKVSKNNLRLFTKIITKGKTRVIWSNVSMIWRGWYGVGTCHLSKNALTWWTMYICNHINVYFCHHFKVIWNKEEIKPILTPTEYSILAADDHWLHLRVTKCFFHCVNNALSHHSTVWNTIKSFKIKLIKKYNNAVAHLLTGTPKYEHIPPIVSSLHRLPMQVRIHF